MKNCKIVILIGFILLSFNSFSQLKNFPILLCKDDTMVIKFLDSVNIAEGHHYTVEKKMPDAMHLFLTETFSLDDQPYYTCYDLIFKFIKMGPFYVCVREDVLSTGDNALANANFIKALFTDKLSDNKWEMKGPPDLPFVHIDATVDKKDNDVSHIRYGIQELDM